MSRLVGALLMMSALSVQADFFTDLKNTRVESDTKVTWKQFGPGNAGFANLLKYHPTLPDVCFTSPDMGNTYQTDDNGLWWSTVKDVDGQSYLWRINDIDYSRTDSSVGYAIEGARMFKTTDTGKSWEYMKNCPWYRADSDGYDSRGWYKKISALGIDPKNENVVYVGGGSHPRGQQHLGWNTLTNANMTNPQGVINTSTAMGQAVVENSGRIWRSDNGGTSWTEVSTGLDSGAQFSRIIVSPKDSNIVYAASTHGLFKSTNKGVNWAQIGTSDFDNNTIMDMDSFYDSSTGEFVLYVIDQVRYYPDTVNKTTTNDGGIFKSVDGGTSWTKINGNLYLDINRLSGGVPYNYKRYVAKWLGISVDDVSANYPNLPTNALQYFNLINVDPSNKDTVYVGFYDAQIQYSIMPGRLWQTTDRGTSWTSIARNYEAAWGNDSAYWNDRGNPISDNMEEGHRISDIQWGEQYGQRSARHFSVNSRGEIMLLYAHNTFLSTDKGVSWKQVNEDYTPDGNIMGRGDSNHPGSCIFQDRRLGEGVMYLGSGEHNLWRTTTDGTNGRQAVKFLENSEETAFAVTTHPWDEKTVFTTSMRQHNMDKIMRSTDSGESWMAWGQATDGTEYYRTNDLTIDPVNPNYMYFGVNRTANADFAREGGFHFSSDGGKTFAKRNAGLPTMPWIVEIEFDPRDKTHASLFAAAQYNPNQSNNGGLYFTSDRGENWSAVTIPGEIDGVNSVTFDHTGRLYITGGRRGGNFNDGGVWYSDNYGGSWTKIFSGEYAYKFDVSSFDYNRLICTLDDLCKNPGFYISEDRGLTWSKNNKMIGQPDKITEIQFDINDEQRINMTVLGSGFLKGAYPGGADSRKITFTPSHAAMSYGASLQSSISVASGIDKNTLLYKSTNSDVVTVSAAGLIEAKGLGAAVIYATTADGRYSDMLPIVVKTNAYPTGLAHAVPGTIQCEDYDLGGADVSFYDTTVGNAGTVYRSDNVDIRTITDEGDGYAVTNTINGEWLEYTVNIPFNGQYDFTMRAASGSSATAGLSIECDGAVVAEKITLPMSGWNDYATTVTANLQLPAGIHTLRLNVIGESMKWNYFSLVESTDYVPVIDVTMPADNTTIDSDGTLAISGTARVYNAVITSIKLYVDGSVVDQTASSPFSFSVNNLSAGEHTYYVEITADNGKVTTTKTQTIVVEAATPPATIALTEGYQVISLNIVPETADIERMFSAVLESSIEFIQDKKGRRLQKVNGSWENGLDDWDSTQAYLVKAKGSVNVDIPASNVLVATTIELTDGINIIPVYADSAESVETIFGSILESHIIWIKDIDGNYLRKVDGSWVNGIRALKAGSGLIVKSSGDCSFSY